MAIEVTIIGLDALGQSIGMALKASPVAINVTLHDRDHSRASEAKQRGAGDRAEWNLPAAVREADLIFINEPLHRIRETLELIGPETRRDVVVTDTCSMKGAVLEWADEILPEGRHFVGGTPLVWADAPSATLLRGRRYAVIPTTRTAEAAVRLVTDAVSQMGAEPLFIDLHEHESLIAAVRQLPALTSAALLQLTAGSLAWKEMATMASPTYAIATSFPTSDSEEMATLLRHNRESLGHWLGAFRGALDSLEALIMQEDGGEALEVRMGELMAAQARWKQAEAKNPDVPHYDDSLRHADETRGMARWFGFGRRKDE